MDFYIGKLSSSLREWQHVLQANGRNLMHKRVATSKHLPSSEHRLKTCLQSMITASLYLRGSRVKWRSGLGFEDGTRSSFETIRTIEINLGRYYILVICFDFLSSVQCLLLLMYYHFDFRPIELRVRESKYGLILNFQG